MRNEREGERERMCLTGREEKSERREGVYQYVWWES